MPFISNVTDTEEQSKYYIGFPKGLNTYQDESLVHDQNLTTAKNAEISVDGVTRRHGTTKVFDEGGATAIYGLGRFYNKAGGTNTFLRMAKVGSDTRLQKLSGSSWTNVDTDTYSNIPACLVQARNKVFIHNGTDSMSYTDDLSSITTYSTVSTPTSLAVTPTGVTGSTDYSYRVEALNATGRTAACARVTTSTGNATLSSANYNALTWDSMSGATAYNIYGRHQTGVGEVYLATVYTNSYDDTGADAEVETLTPNENDTTGGIKAKNAVFTIGRQFAIGVTEGSTYYPTRLYYSGTIDYVDSFVGGDYDGGWVDIESNDGGEIVDIAPYQNGVLVLKTNGAFKFYFTSAGLPAVDEITKSIGGISSRAGRLIDNDYVFVGQKDNRIAIMVVGQQAGFVSSQLRVNDIGMFISNDLVDAEWSELDNTASFYYDYKYGFTYTLTGDTENSKGYVLDLRYGGWVEWDGDPVDCSQYMVFDDESNVYLYGASNTDAYVVRMFQEDRNDSGVAFTTRVISKRFNQDMFNVKKVYRNPAMWFKYVASGSPSVYCYTDGNEEVGTASISPSDSGTMVGEILTVESLAGGSPHTMLQAEVRADYPIELIMLKIARTIDFRIVDSGNNSNWIWMGINVKYTPLEGMPMDQEYKVYLS